MLKDLSIVDLTNKTFDTCLFYICKSHDEFSFLKIILKNSLLFFFPIAVYFTGFH